MKKLLLLLALFSAAGVYGAKSYHLKQTDILSFLPTNPHPGQKVSKYNLVYTWHPHSGWQVHRAKHPARLMGFRPHAAADITTHGAYPGQVVNTVTTGGMMVFVWAPSKDAGSKKGYTYIWTQA